MLLIIIISINYKTLEMSVLHVKQFSEKTRPKGEKDFQNVKTDEAHYS